MKKCNKCNIEKKISEFNKKSDSKDGHHPSCKECRKVLHKKYYEEKKENILLYQKEYYLSNSSKVKLREKMRRIENPELYKEYEKKRRSSRKNYINEYFKKRLKDDVLFKVTCNIRKRINKFIKNKSKSTEKVVGISFVELKDHLEKQFKEGMNWNNYGMWHIDHIIPLSSANNEDEIHKLCHYTNLQPLWAKDNLKKSNKIL